MIPAVQNEPSCWRETEQSAGCDATSRIRTDEPNCPMKATATATATGDCMHLGLARTTATLLPDIEVMLSEEARSRCDTEATLREHQVSCFGLVSLISTVGGQWYCRGPNGIP